MHPALIVLIIVGVPLGAWAAYEGAEYVREWWSERQDRKEYEEFVRHYNEKHTVFRDESFDSVDNDDDDEPLAKSVLGRRGYGDGYLRHRRQHSSRNANKHQFMHNDYELSEMEKTIIARRERLAKEQALLEQEEMDLHRRRQSLQSRGNSLMGMPSPPSLQSSQQQRQQPLESSTPSLGSSHTARNNNWVFARPPLPMDAPTSTAATPADLGPKLGAFEAAEWDAIRYQHSNSSDDGDDENGDSKRGNMMRMPEPQQERSRNVSESEDSWADVHEQRRQRMQSGTLEDVMSYSSSRTPSSPRHSYGVRSISSFDDSDG
ncbi:hypothetical protein BDB00DRAFT_789199 [Zychaea mexicana]|uniref:uncharacterized protein n=1 Tax=Zychaea mexicana TaxID=64656 RepID=UPI0022FF377C|nr:uncharacterized protein BDB00DRAFT_789199 [Zychaea mexicana]KAI9491883.1 hypothetical protein BDB00DRAFT_789199 [Zychaea mexicana]